jgi:hypothetical protein
MAGLRAEEDLFDEDEDDNDRYVNVRPLVCIHAHVASRPPHAGADIDMPELYERAAKVAPWLERTLQHMWTNPATIKEELGRLIVEVSHAGLQF